MVALELLVSQDVQSQVGPSGDMVLGDNNIFEAGYLCATRCSVTGDAISEKLI
jgi:hypothetical protein